MILESITLETAIKLATPKAKALFKDKIAPLISTKINAYFKDKAAIRGFEKKSIKYISQLTAKCSTLNTITFQNSPKKLEDLYVPLTIQESGSDSEIMIDQSADIFTDSKHVLITDSAGMGKSTLSKRVVLNIISKDDFVPVFVELRGLDNRPVGIQIAERFGITHDSPNEILIQLPFVYIFDGLDEVSTDIQKEVIDSINEFSHTFSESNILVTSRKESFLAEFYKFKRYSINPLKESEAFSIIQKCDPSNIIAKQLIDGIEKNKETGIREFLSTPLYVSLLFCSYRHKPIIPKKKHLFYSQVYEALFEAHDLSKEVGYVRQKNSGLDSAEFHSILRRLGFWCLKNSGKIEFQKDELEIELTKILSKVSGIDTNVTSFIKDLTTTVPLFVKEGASIRWSHKSLMEYFASMFICHDVKVMQEEVLLHFFNSDDWSAYTNIFELCADIDYGPFRASIVKAVLESFSAHRDTSYKSITNRRISEEQISERIALTYSSKSGFCIGSSSGSNNFEHKLKEIAYAGKSKGELSVKINKSNHDYPGILIASGQHPENKIFEILNTKSPELFLKQHVDENGLDSLLNESSIPKGRIHIIDDNPNHIINNSANFGLVNRILWIVSPLVLNEANALFELNRIKADHTDGVGELLNGLI